MQIELLIPSLHGWCSVERASEFASFIVARKPQRTLEIGVFGGRLTLAMALAHKFVGVGKVIGIDPWKASASTEGQNETNAQWWGRQNMHDEVYESFMNNVRNLDLQNWIQIEKKRSDEFTPPKNIGIMAIDGNHEGQAIKDVKRYAPSVPLGGVCYMDDVHWESNSVGRAVKLLGKMGFQKIHDRDTGAYFVRNK